MWEGGKAARLNSLAWQQNHDMIVGNCPACRCVECVREWGLNGKSAAKKEGGMHWCECECVCPPAQLCWKAASVWSSQLGLFYLVCWSDVNSLRGYSLVWHGRVWSALPASMWMREQQWADQSIEHSINPAHFLWCCVRGLYWQEAGNMIHITMQ